LAPFLEDPRITDLCLNGHLRLFVDRGDGLNEVREWPGFPDESEFKRMILDQLSSIGRSWDAKHPFVDGVFFGSHRAHVAFPPLTSGGIHLSLRRLPIPSSPEHCRSEARLRWEPDATAFELLVRAVQSRETILLCGGTGSGKTTLLSDLLGFIPDHERIIALEDTAEIRPGHPHFVGLLARPPNADGCGEVTIRDLLRQTLRMRPDRILLGECRGEEVLDLLQALNSGHQGTLATLHANSPRDALRRLELLALLAARTSLAAGWMRELLAHGIQWVAHLERIQGRRRIRSIIRIEGIDGGTLLCRPVQPDAPPDGPARARP
jgi:pilus assembly protein CpaF